MLKRFRTKKDPHPRPLPAYRARGSQLAAVFIAGALLAGCATAPQAEIDRNIAATQPSNVAVSSDDFEKLWAAADIASRDLLFNPERQDRREGIYQTEPMTSAQWFEPWRREVRTVADREQSSLASVRRTITVNFVRNDDGTFTAKPSVLVERYSLTERRITTSAGYRNLFADRYGGYGTFESDAGVVLPPSYWYPVGNDPKLEEYLARAMEARLARS